MKIGALVLRDIHEPVAPSWWPPAPGWWLVALAIVLLAAWFWWRSWKRRVHSARVQAVFDRTVDAAATPATKVAAISELLRRASRRKDPAADRLDGEDWMAFLDSGLPEPTFVSGPGALLRDGAFRPDPGTDAVEALRIVARARFLDWMGVRP